MRVFALVLAILLLPVLPAGAEGEKLLALTFDDGPSRFTGELLDGLAERDAKATFFMTGINGASGIENHLPLLSRMWREGHQLGSHTYSHSILTDLSDRALGEELARVEQRLFEAAGGEYRVMLRAPGGLVNDRLCRRLAVPLVNWSVDTRDWKLQDEERVYRQIVENAADGAVILLHDIYGTSVRAALRAVDTLAGEGYEFVTVAELLRRRGVEPESGRVYAAAPPGESLPPYDPPTVWLEADLETGEVRVQCGGEPGLTIHYTLDGRYPTLADPVAEGPVPLPEGARFTAVGVDRWGTRTEAASVTAPETVPRRRGSAKN